MSWEEGIQKKNKRDPFAIYDEIGAREGYIKEDEAKKYLYDLMIEDVTLSTYLLMGVTLAPHQHIAVKAMLNNDYVLNIWGRGSAKTFSAAIAASLIALFNSGIHIGILSSSFRQSKLLMKKIEEIAAEDEAALFNQCITGKPSHNNDEWTIKIGKSKITALPLGCLSPDTLVMTDSGFRFFGDLFSEEDKNEEKKWSDLDSKVLSSYGKMLSSSGKYHNGFKDTKRIITRNGFEIEGTYDHKVKIIDEDLEIKWKELQDIKNGDHVLIDRTECWFENCDKEVNPDNAYMLGCMIADGCWTDKTRLEFINIDPSIVESFKKCSKDYDRWKNYNEDYRYFRCGTAHASEWMSFWGLKKAYSHQKIIPNKMLSADKESMASLLRGLFDCDGHIQIGKNIEKGGACIGYTTTSEILSNQMQQILLRFGIVSFRKNRDRGLTKLGNQTKRVYEIIISGQNVHKYYEKIGFNSERKQEQLKRYCLNAKRINTCSDGIPFAKTFLIDLMEKYRFQNFPNVRTLKGNHLRKKEIITFDFCQKAINDFSHTEDPIVDKIKNVCNRDLFYNRVEVIEDSKSDTFDLNIPQNNTYIANGFISHNTGEKLRGFRFQCLIIDELLLMPEKTLNEVILPFLGSIPNPTEREQLRIAEEKLIDAGEITREEMTAWPNNKFIGLSSASYKFEYLYELYQVYERLILGANTTDDFNIDEKVLEKFQAAEATRAIIHMSYEAVPEWFYDQNLITQARESMSEPQFDREFRSIFKDESGGFFSMKVMKERTIPEGATPSLKIKGDKGKKYLLAVDPNWSSGKESSDDFAMCVLELDQEKKRSTLVHAYARHGGSLREHLQYFDYLYNNFSPEMVWIDHGGGHQFIGSCNESSLFKDKKIELGIVEEDFDDVENYDKCIRKARRLYDKEKHRLVFIRDFGKNKWIRRANELLQANLSHQRLWFGGRCMEDSFEFQLSQDIPSNFRFNNPEEDAEYVEEDPRGRKIELIERQFDMVNLTKAECALIEVSSNPQGNQTFDLPQNLKRQTGPNKTRKDSYSALLIANWGATKFYDMFDKNVSDESDSFTPFMI